MSEIPPDAQRALVRQQIRGRIIAASFAFSVYIGVGVFLGIYQLSDCEDSLRDVVVMYIANSIAMVTLVLAFFFKRGDGDNS